MAEGLHESRLLNRVNDMTSNPVLSWGPDTQFRTYKEYLRNPVVWIEQYTIRNGPWTNQIVMRRFLCSYHIHSLILLQYRRVFICISSNQ
jgi:hypothetical protein